MIHFTCFFFFWSLWCKSWAGNQHACRVQFTYNHSFILPKGLSFPVKSQANSTQVLSHLNPSWASQFCLWKWSIHPSTDWLIRSICSRSVLEQNTQHIIAPPRQGQHSANGEWSCCAGSIIHGRRWHRWGTVGGVGKNHFSIRSCKLRHTQNSGCFHLL